MAKLFEKAKPALPYLNIAMMGQAGAGKTYTALLLGEGLAKHEGKRMAVIDTDPGSPASLYAKPMGNFDFDSVKPTSVQELIEIIEEFDTDKYGVLILDTITWLWRAILTMDSVQKTSIGLPVQGAWNKLKPLYREVLMPMQNMKCHSIITGRETVDYDRSTSEIVAIGFKMIAEKETQFEPNLFIRLELKRGSISEKIPQTHIAEVLRDRTGTLEGKRYECMTYEDLVPLVKHQCGELVPEPNETEMAIKDQGLLERAKEKAEKFEKESAALRDEFIAKIFAIKNKKELDEVKKEANKLRKRDLTEEDRTTLRGHFDEAKERIDG
jgi:hypothetical protein